MREIKEKIMNTTEYNDDQKGLLEREEREERKPKPKNTTGYNDEKKRIITEMRGTNGDD